MKKFWYTDDVQKEYEKLRVREWVEKQLDEIDIDFAGYSVDPIGGLQRVFIYPMIDDELKPRNEFNEEEMRSLRKELETKFGFKNEKVPPTEKKDGYSEKRYYWIRDFRKESGTFHSVRYLEKLIEEKYDLYFLIERTPKLNCRVVEKEVTRKEYEAICD